MFMCRIGCYYVGQCILAPWRLCAKMTEVIYLRIRFASVRIAEPDGDRKTRPIKNPAVPGLCSRYYSQRYLIFASL